MKINKFHKSLSINSQNYTKYNMKLFIILSCNKNLKGGNKMSQSEELVLIPKYEKYSYFRQNTGDLCLLLKGISRNYSRRRLQDRME